MFLYRCNLTLHDNVFFATREMGTLYETEKYLHNWALSYAFFGTSHIPTPYRLQGLMNRRPGYFERDNEQNLLNLNEAGIYMFPAMPLKWSYQVNTFKAAQVPYYGKSKQFGDKGADRNYPINFGRAKELAVGSTYRTYLASHHAIEIPRWIRLGKWASKIEVEGKLIPQNALKAASGVYTCEHPLNPIDLPSSSRLLLYNRVVMPPVSLISQARLSGQYWEITKPDNWAVSAAWSGLEDLPNRVCLPQGGAYGARIATTPA